jgi:hypothetical protein
MHARKESEPQFQHQSRNNQEIYKLSILLFAEVGHARCHRRGRGDEVQY